MFGIDKHIRFATTVVSGTWNDTQKPWSLDVRCEPSTDLNMPPRRDGNGSWRADSDYAYLSGE